MNVEIQLTNQKNIHKRSLYYGANIPYDPLIPIDMFEDIECLVVNHLKEVISYLSGQQVLPLTNVALIEEPTLLLEYQRDFSHIIGHEQAKQALEVAAAGGHNVLMSGPPGCG